MPVTIAIYDCHDCTRRDDCPDYDFRRRFGWDGAQLLPGAGSIRCHHAQHNRRKDYSVDLQGMRLRELLSRFGFIDIGHDDGCLNRCRECARTDCDLHPRYSAERVADFKLSDRFEERVREAVAALHRVKESKSSDPGYTATEDDPLRAFRKLYGDALHERVNPHKTEHVGDGIHEVKFTAEDLDTLGQKRFRIYSGIDRLRKTFVDDSKFGGIVKALKRLGLL